MKRSIIASLILFILVSHVTSLMRHRKLDDGTAPADKDASDTSENTENDEKGMGENGEDGEDGDDSEEEQPHCHNEMLYSFGVLNSGYINRTSTLCGSSVKESCCSKVSEDIIHNYWQHNNRAKIKMYIEAYIYFLKGILNFYEDYIEKAKSVDSYPGSPDECKSAATYLIEHFVKKADINKFITDLEKAYQHLGFARKSFYCVLCSVDTQQYFNIEEQTIIFAREFCENLVQATIESFYQRSVDYMRIFNSMNVLANCDPNKEYVPDVYQIDLTLDEDQMSKISSCHKSFEKDKDPRIFYHDCKQFCSSYSLTSANELIEGNFGKLYYLFRKICKTGDTPLKKLFDEIDYDVKYNFSFVSSEFYETNLVEFNLNEYTIEFEREGIELFYIAGNTELKYQSNARVETADDEEDSVSILSWVALLLLTVKLI